MSLLDGKPYKYDPAYYQYEKIIGKRTPSGNLRLKRLKPIHRQILGYHLRGLSAGEISNITGYSEVAISRILNDPLSKAHINEILRMTDMELEALAPMAVTALRDALDENEDIRVRLLATDKLLKATGRYDRQAKDKETAEDVISRALGIMKTQSETIKEITTREQDIVNKTINMKPERDFKVIEGDVESED